MKGNHWNALYLSGGLWDKIEKIIEKQYRKGFTSAECCREYKSRSCADKRGITAGQVLGTGMAPVLEWRDKSGPDLGESMERVRFQLDLARWVGAGYAQKRNKSPLDCINQVIMVGISIWSTQGSVPVWLEGTPTGDIRLYPLGQTT